MLGEKLKKIFNLTSFKDSVFLLVALFLGFYFNWNVLEIGIFCLFIYIILHPLSSRILAAPALFFLVLIPFLLVFNQEIIAEQMAIYCYYFLILAAIMGVYEMKKEDRRKDL